ncbi:hypothetical protein KORDIASMS9_01284 [Kordia sp. SMS9]|uniref:hypothetical protein n=1 Tax=Kordia sp. SMS9 TaxID=2282170 RepID=UPI000E0CFF7E|nr:hypothetical protein [Kordia sp. SMS9]AXG69065.1 hypothetical protein KORDIASMS9_01284 [Kordia sp. SMS9]
MIDLITQNKFQELKEKIQNDEDALAIQQFLVAILNGEENIEIDGESFDSKKYQEEFFEGLKIYKALKTSKISQKEFTAYSDVLVKLAFKTAGFIRLLANTAMEKGVFLSDIPETYQVSPNLRASFQEFIDLLKAKDDVKSVANISAAKAQITTSVANLLPKEAIGNDMLQFAASYAAVGQTEHAMQIYQGIMNDFESESVKNSSGLFPELNQVDTRPAVEIEVFEKAKAEFEKLSGEEFPEKQRMSVNDSELAQKLAAEVHKKEKEILDKSQNESKGFFSKLKSFFTGK